ncbi:AAA family ATPase [Levilactobacillus humaensis]|uniref:AAA family ATPase n=1 Tax=Levilactobacillus humaensis TaxID=2950375 RepID=UPI0021C3596B|nr:ATP-binding protein [Levilactobacillus humaensis]
MISGIYIKNFKSYLESYIDLHKTKSIAKEMVAIYGENGSGKTNIVETLEILRLSIDTVIQSKMLTSMQAHAQDNISIDELRQTVKGSSLSRLLQETHTIDSSDNTLLHFEFIIDKVEGYYEIEYDSKERLVHEELYFTGNKRRTTLISISDKQSTLNKSFFKRKKVRDDLQENIEKLWGTHTFLAILRDYLTQINHDYLSRSFATSILKVMNELGSISLLTDDVTGFFPPKSLLPDVRQGTISINDSEKIDRTSDALSEYLRNMYSDINGAYYQRDVTDNKINYELILQKEIGDEVRDIPIHLESKGTKKILELFPLFMNLFDGRIVVIDEIDSGIHDILIEGILSDMQHNFPGQLIFTTHDTLLMKMLPASSVFVISTSGHASKEIYPISEYTETNNNPTNQYLHGEFSGVPALNDLHFKEIWQTTLSDSHEA